MDVGTLLQRDTVAHEHTFSPNLLGYINKESSLLLSPKLIVLQQIKFRLLINILMFVMKTKPLQLR